MNTEQKILTRDLGPENLHRIDVYLQSGGYRAVKKALTQCQPGSILEEIKKSGLRGRGGAGFPTGLKWSFVPQKTDARKYLCVNADEGEPGTFKDRFILGHLPHLLIEGVIIASYAVGIPTAYVYIRGEYETLARRLELAIDEAYEKGFLGKDILKSGFDLELFLHRGAGAYICGEETALLESLEGKRGYPRLKPPFPATVGLFQKPTVINNIETLANIAPIILYGADWFLSRGLPNEGGTRLFGVSGAVTIQYPEQKKELARRHRSLHRLMTRADGKPRCVACFLCATVCPSECIAIEAAEDPDPEIQKYPAAFVIDLNRCCFCGFCVEACPEDAIRMDTAEIDLAQYSHEDLIYGLDKLLDGKD